MDKLIDTLLIATHNPGKLKEYRQLLADLPIAVTSLAEQQITIVVAETGATFAENAALKARAYAARSGLWTWADDSGLEIDPLAGRPGVFSARYGRDVTRATGGTAGPDHPPLTPIVTAISVCWQNSSPCRPLTAAAHRTRIRAAIPPGRRAFAVRLPLPYRTVNSIVSRVH